MVLVHQLITLKAAVVALLPVLMKRQKNLRRVTYMCSACMHAYSAYMHGVYTP
jgi:cyanate permease